MSATFLVAGALIALLLSAGLAAAIERFADRIGAVARPRDDRWHDEPVPLLGGVAIYLTVVVVSLVFLPLRDVRSGLLLAGGSMIFLLGLVDDFRTLTPRTKLTVETLVALGLAAVGLRLTLTPYPIVNVTVTVIWIVGLVNALNLLDNIDGLAAGIAVIAASFRLALFVMDGNDAEALTAAIFIGATAGFLIHNWHPASIFMGDAGSLFLGFYLAGLGLIGDWPYSRGTASVLIVPVLLLLVPIFEATWLTITRRLSGRSIAAGGRDHVSHRLVRSGISEQRAVALLYGIAILSGLLGLLSHRFGLSRTGVLIAFAAIALVIFAVRLAQLAPDTAKSQVRGASPSGTDRRVGRDGRRGNGEPQSPALARGRRGIG